MTSRTKIFYARGRLTTVLGAKWQKRMLWGDSALLVEACAPIRSAMVLGTDSAGSVVGFDSRVRTPLTYEVYGYSLWVDQAAPLFRFKAALLCEFNFYALGNGSRYYSVVLRRFCSPDALSPFGKGGYNTYAYCSGDPVNRTDPTGRAWEFLRRSDYGTRFGQNQGHRGMGGNTNQVTHQLSSAVIENLGKMEPGRHFAGVMSVRSRRIDIAISSQLGSPGSDIDKPLPKGLTYQIGSGMKGRNVPVALDGLHTIGTRAGGKPLDITGHAMMVKMLGGKESHYVGFSGIKRNEDTVRLKWNSRTLNPSHAPFMVRYQLGNPGLGRDYILNPSLQRKIIRQFEQSGFNVISN